MRKSGKTSMFCRHNPADSSPNKFYLLRARPLRWVACSAAPRQRCPRRTSGTLVLCSSGRRSGHIFACDEDATSKNVKVKPTLCEHCRAKIFTRILARALVLSQDFLKISISHAAAHSPYASCRQSSYMNDWKHLCSSDHRKLYLLTADSLQ